MGYLEATREAREKLEKQRRGELPIPEISEQTIETVCREIVAHDRKLDRSERKSAGKRPAA